MRKVLTGVNFEHKKLGLRRARINNYATSTCVIYNFRSLVHKLGYDCSLLSDDEILGLSELVHSYEVDGDEFLIEALDFLVMR